MDIVKINGGGKRHLVFFGAFKDLCSEPANFLDIGGISLSLNTRLWEV